MPDYLDVKPDQLRRMAEQHGLVAANIRKFGEIPHDWLADFPSKYGTIADPVRGALEDYYQRRHDNAERLAANHERTRDELLAAARALEDGDQAGKQQIGQAGGFDHKAPPDGPDAPTDPVRKVDAGPDTPMMNDALPEQPSLNTPETPGMVHETGRSDQVPLSPAASAPQTYDTASVGPTVPTPTTPFSVGLPERGTADLLGTPAVDANSAAGVAVDGNSAAGMTGGMATPLAAGPFPAAGAASGAPVAPRMPSSLASGPFAAVAHAAKDRRALPSFVVGEQVHDDLVLARTLLAATLAAVGDSALGPEWAVAVGRTRIGPVVMLTSSEGRGWLPPGLFLPSEVALPWRWDSVLGAEARKAIAALEGTADPARVLAEFGLMVRRRKGVRLSALASSAAILDDVHAALGDDVAIEGLVSASESAVDLTSPGVGLVDRLALAGSGELLRQAATVPELEIRETCLELAQAADARVRTAVTGIDADVDAHRARRQRILDAMQAGRPVPASWWDEIRAADDMSAATLRSRRVDVSHVPVGVRLDVSAMEVLRGMVFERRADELLLLLAAGEPDRQTLRDALYAYGQIIEHPLVAATASVAGAQMPKTTGTGSAVPGVQVGRGVGLGAPGVSSISVSSIGSGGASPSIAEFRTVPAGSKGSGEQRRA
ncbi:hypothetical protein IU459_22280 [Nocardia amamiensis]|uniref:Uncharacterized protein n=1 Tax=Nocardia amamiensis TaxID=404578 RepID=A0ABS0CV95_9NOCA|nr:type VII secretion target [Nocardia amamiensis]MBF6300251.1 hypothetical protein [Nocardia amamiensis]